MDDVFAISSHFTARFSLTKRSARLFRAQNANTMRSCDNLSRRLRRKTRSRTCFTKRLVRTRRRPACKTVTRNLHVHVSERYREGRTGTNIFQQVWTCRCVRKNRARKRKKKNLLFARGRWVTQRGRRRDERHNDEGAEALYIYIHEDIYRVLRKIASVYRNVYAFLSSLCKFS